MPKISELNSGAPAVSTDALVIQRDASNYSVTMENVASFVTTDFASKDIVVSGFWKYENQFVVNFQGDEWWWWNGFYVEAYDPTYTVVWSMAEDIPGGGTGDPDAGFAAALFSNTGSVAPYFEFDRARGTSGNPDFVDAGDSLGTIQWRTYTSDSGVPPFNGIDRNSQATISVVVDEDRTTTGTDYESVSMYFQVADGALRNFMRLEGGNGLSLYDGSGVVATGGGQGAGTINAKGLYVDGVEILPTVPVTTDANTSRTLDADDMNTLIQFTSGSAVTVSLNTGVGAVGNSVVIVQMGAGAVTVSGTATIYARSGTITAGQYAAMTLMCLAADTWLISGDTTT